MVQIEDTLISEAVFNEAFTCDLNACKGACCVEGEAGAPLEKEEASLLEKLLPALKPFLTDNGLKAIAVQGAWVSNAFQELETPLINGKECVYTIFDGSGKASCGIEAAYNAGAVNFKKPVSCHLYPIRVQKLRLTTAVNYHEWSICKPGCQLGVRLKMPLYKFVQEALIRKFGEAWYSQLELAARAYG